MEKPEVLKANTDQPLALEPDYSGLKIAPPAMVWLAGAAEAVMNVLLWLLEALLNY